MSAVADTLRTLEIFLPGDGWLVSFAEVYADESYREGSPLLTVAGYLFRRSGARGFANAWGPYLNDKMGYPHFHMTDMLAQQKEFVRCEKPEADLICRRLIREIHTWTAFGFAVTVHEPSYEAEIGGRWGLPPNAMGFALLQTMIMVRRWIERSGFDGQVSYFCEQGNPHQGDADRFLTELIQKSETNRARYNYRTHAFLPKDTHWLHPADYLAWHWSQEMQRQDQAERSHPVRADLRALISRPQDVTMDYRAEHVRALAEELRARYGQREPNWQTFNYDRFRRGELA